LPDGKRKAKKTVRLAVFDEGLGLEFGQKEICHSLEWVGRVRNYVTHSSIDLTVVNDRFGTAVKCLAVFPVLLVEAASKKYPKSCTEQPPEEGDDGTPGYVFAEVFF